MATGEGEASGKEGHSMGDCLWSIHCVHIMLEGRGVGEREREGECHYSGGGGDISRP